MSTEFDNYSNDYRKLVDNSIWFTGESSEFFAQYRAVLLAEWFAKIAQEKLSILDFGCGDGLTAHCVSKKFLNSSVYGVDPSIKSIELAHKSYPKITFSTNLEAQTALDFPDNSFDLIYASGVFHHIPFELHRGYLAELKRISKKNGSIIIFEHNPINPVTRFIVARSPIDRNAKLLMPWYSYKLGKKYGTPQTKFFGFFPKRLESLRPIEKYFTKLPLGALYATIIKINKL